MGDMVEVVGCDKEWWLVEARGGPVQLKMSACRDGEKGGFWDECCPILK